MNNNMPNNFNNGFPSNNDKPINNGPVGPNGAKEQLMGGQSAAGNGPGIMQGVGNVQNDSRIMQGNVVPNKPETPVMPGQGHSGINASTLQKEELKPENPDIISVPNFAPNIPEPPKPEVKPEPQPIPNVNPNVNIDKPINMNPTLSQPTLETTPQSVVSPQIDVNNVQPAPDVKKENVGSSAADIPNQSEVNTINPAPNNLGQVNNQNLNSFPFNNINQQNSQPNSQPVSGMPTNMNNAPVGGMVMDNPVPNKPVNGMGTMPNQPNVVMGPANMNEQAPKPVTGPLDNDVVEMPNIPDKKFPLSTREMILIGVALIGIIAVIIVYWP